MFLSGPAFTLTPTPPKKELFSESLGIQFNFSVFSFSIPVAATFDFMTSRIGPVAKLLLLVDHFGPICVTIKSTVAATGNENLKNA